MSKRHVRKILRHKKEFPVLVWIISAVLVFVVGYAAYSTYVKVPAEASSIWDATQQKWVPMYVQANFSNAPGYVPTYPQPGKTYTLPAQDTVFSTVTNTSVNIATRYYWTVSPRNAAIITDGAYQINTDPRVNSATYQGSNYSIGSEVVLPHQERTATPQIVLAPYKDFTLKLEIANRYGTAKWESSFKVPKPVPRATGVEIEAVKTTIVENSQTYATTGTRRLFNVNLAYNYVGPDGQVLPFNDAKQYIIKKYNPFGYPATEWPDMVYWTISNTPGFSDGGRTVYGFGGNSFWSTMGRPTVYGSTSSSPGSVEGQFSVKMRLSTGLSQDELNLASNTITIKIPKSGNVTIIPSTADATPASSYRPPSTPSQTPPPASPVQPAPQLNSYSIIQGGWGLELRGTNLNLSKSGMAPESGSKIIIKYRNGATKQFADTQFFGDATTLDLYADSAMALKSIASVQLITPRGSSTTSVVK